MIIDSHCHAGKGEGLTGPWDTAAPLDKYLIRADQAGITHTVLFAAFHSDYAIANREVARIVSSHPERFFGFAFVNSVHDRGRVHKLVRQAVEEFGFVGIKLHRYDAPISREICEAARAFSLPVLYDVMSAVSVCELLAGEYPDGNSRLCDHGPLGRGRRHDYLFGRSAGDFADLLRSGHLGRGR